MRIVVNRCFGGFGLSHDAIMRYSEIIGFKLYPFVNAVVNGRTDFNKFVPYDGTRAFIVHYSKQPLTDDGRYVKDSYFSDNDIERTDPVLIQVIEEMGSAANGPHAELEIREIPDGIDWYIHEYDGLETIEEAHRSW